MPRVSITEHKPRHLISDARSQIALIINCLIECSIYTDQIATSYAIEFT